MSRNRQRDSILYLTDMVEGMERIRKYLEGLDYDSFFTNFLVQDAVIRNFQIIGEAARNVDEEIKSKYPQVPWKKMYGLRNLVSHEYFGIDLEMIWAIANRNIPQNLQDIRQILKEISQD